MAITICSRCSEQFQIRITSSEAQNKLKNLEQENSVLCLGCFKSLQEYDVVKVIGEINAQPEVEIGDVGAVLMVFNNGEAFEVESVLHNGQTKWQAILTRKQIKWLQTPE